MQHRLLGVRGLRPIRSAAFPLLLVLSVCALLVGLDRRAAAQKIEIEEVDLEKQVTTTDGREHFSLLGDGHEDKIYAGRVPDHFSIDTRRFVVIADGKSFVPVERLEEDADGGETIKYFLFRRSIHGDCMLADVKFFRKIVDGKVAGFYAIQWDRWLGDVLPDDFGGYDDFRNAIIVYELFRFERREGKPEGDYSRFRKVAEKRIVVQSCDEAKVGDDILRLIRDN